MRRPNVPHVEFSLAKENSPRGTLGHHRTRWLSIKALSPGDLRWKGANDEAVRTSANHSCDSSAEAGGLAGRREAPRLREGSPGAAQGWAAIRHRWPWMVIRGGRASLDRRGAASRMSWRLARSTPVTTHLLHQVVVATPSRYANRCGVWRVSWPRLALARTGNPTHDVPSRRSGVKASRFRGAQPRTSSCDSTADRTRVRHRPR